MLSDERVGSGLLDPCLDWPTEISALGHTFNDGDPNIPCIAAGKGLFAHVPLIPNTGSIYIGNIYRTIIGGIVASQDQTHIPRC